MRPRAAVWLERPLRTLDRLFDRIYGSKYNPLYQSGNLAVLALLLTIASGLYLLFFYDTADPYGSIAHINEHIFLGAFARSLHRYSGDVAVIAVVVHALRMFLGGRTWGPRALAWTSGVFLLAVLLASGWTGFILVWDVQGQIATQQVARLMDALPIFSEPISRSFLDATRPQSSFFFINLFLHVALPLTMAVLLLVHVLRVARPKLLPPRPIAWSAGMLMCLVAIVFPAPMLPEANLLRLPGTVEIDFIFGFWLPPSQAISPWQIYGAWLVALAAMLSAPIWWKPRGEKRPPSVVLPHLCVGCEQCYLDCPYEAISMVDRTEPSKLSDRVAWVDPNLCVSCGMCTPSCAPMCVGPTGRTGRDEIRRLQVLIDRMPDVSNILLVLGCCNGLGKDRRLEIDEHTVVAEIDCLGSLHTSVIEFALRSGVSGVAVISCPERNCQYRGGPEWLRERIYNNRPAELKDRVDKNRVQIFAYSPSETKPATRALANFRRHLQTLGAHDVESKDDWEHTP